MPGRDGTGPNGMGTRTGRGLGMCTGVEAPSYGRGFGPGYGMGGGLRARNGFGGGARYGRGNGGRGWQSNAPIYSGNVSATQEQLEGRAAMLEAELSSLRQRMAEMEKKNAE